MGDLLIEKDCARGCILLPVGAKSRGPATAGRSRLIHIREYDAVAYVVRRDPSTAQIGSEVVFCFPGLRFDVFSPSRDSRYCYAAKPGKEEHKSHNYRSAILMVHRFRSFLSVFTLVLRKIWREVTRKVRFARLKR
jgi:hypothetical protein